MKTIKYFTVFLILIFSNCSRGQIINKLTISEYNNIYINGINWMQIDKTKGDVNQMKIFFGNNLVIKKDTEPSLTIHFRNNSKGIYFRFEENNPNIIDDYTLVKFKITNNSSNLTIKGKTVTIGDNISKLGNVQINSSGNDIIYGTNKTDDIILIKFNEITKKITSIEYTFFN